MQFVLRRLPPPAEALVSTNGDRLSFSKKGRKTLSLNIHNLIYSIIIYHSTPLRMDQRMGEIH